MSVYKLKNDGLICYLESDYGGKYNLAAIALEKEPNKVYVSSYFSGMNEMNCCYINDYLVKKLGGIITAQLDAYVRAHSCRYDFYKILNKDGINRFYANNIRMLGDSVPKPSFNLGYNGLIDGAVSVEMNRQSFQYDFRTGEVRADKPLFYLHYQDYLDLIVAKEQLRLGVAPQALTELYSFQEALKEKQTVSVIFKDGETVITRRNGFRIGDIFYFTVGQDSISYSLNSRSLNYYGDKGVNDIEYLKLGKVKYQFNGETLNKLHKPSAPEYAWQAA